MTPSQEDANELLLRERHWLENLLVFRAEVMVSDTGLGMGQADLIYERAGHRWSLTLRAEGVE